MLTPVPSFRSQTIVVTPRKADCKEPYFLKEAMILKCGEESNIMD